MSNAAHTSIARHPWQISPPVPPQAGAGPRASAGRTLGRFALPLVALAATALAASAVAPRLVVGAIAALLGLGLLALAPVALLQLVLPPFGAAADQAPLAVAPAPLPGDAASGGKNVS